MKIRSLAATAALAISLPLTTHAQLLISEFLANPSGSDSPFEWVEFIATSTIDFSATPYSVVWADNGSTRFGTNGWVTGSGVTYGFEITSGVVNRGDVVYVGGSSMAPTGTKLRTINTGTTAGDGFGLAASGGVLGNGGNVADGIAVFNTSIANVTSSLTPVDAILFGNSFAPTGNVFLAAYQLPNNDRYSGGTPTVNSYLGPDPGAGQTILATGAYNTDTGTWELARDWTLGAMSDGASGVTLTTVPEPSMTMLLAASALAGALMWRRRK
jgi:hypothetical protein